jgi:hypothetical protein
VLNVWAVPLLPAECEAVVDPYAVVVPNSNWYWVAWRFARMSASSVASLSAIDTAVVFARPGATVISPIRPGFPVSANHMLPSGPDSIPDGDMLLLGSVNSEIVPAVVMRPTRPGS